MARVTANRRPTMSDIARLTGVSAMTVSRALKSDAEVSEETRARIRQVADELGYVTDQTARVLSQGRTGFVAALIPSLNNPHFADTVRGLTDGLAGHDLQLLLGHSEYRPEREETLLRTLLGRRPEAVVLTMDGHSSESRSLLRRAGVPTIEIWDLPASPIRHVVGYSNRDAAAALTRRLIARGYRRFGYVGETEDQSTRGAARRDGHLEALAAAGLPTDRVVQHGLPPLGMEEGGRAFLTLMERWPDTEIVICVSDACAFGAVAQAQRQGWAVPDRVGIAGFGDVEVSRAAHPRITTVRVDGLAIGRATADIILADLAQQGTPPVIRDVGYTVLERETTALTRG